MDAKTQKAVSAIYDGSFADSIKKDIKYTVSGIFIGALSGYFVGALFGNRLLFGAIGALAFGISGYKMANKKE